MNVGLSISKHSSQVSTVVHRVASLSSLLFSESFQVAGTLCWLEEIILCTIMADCVVETCNRTVVNAFHALLLTCMFSSLNIQSTYSYWLTLFVVKDHQRDGVLVLLN